MHTPALSATPVGKSKARKGISEKTRRTTAFYLMISPWFIVFLIFGLYPLLYGLYLSFTNFVGFNINHLKIVGLQNYKNVFTDTDAMFALGRTFLVTILYVPISTLIGLLLALLLNQKIRGMGIYRTIFYLPSIVPVVSIGLMFRFMYAEKGGIINNILSFLHLPTVSWLGYDHATLSLVIMMLWGAGGAILINLAGLKGISRDLYEASSIDGASAFKRFISITMPLMTPVIFFNVVTGIIHAFQMYIQPILLTGLKFLDAPIRPNYLYAVHAFQQVFAFQRFAYGMALLWIMFIVILLLTIVVFATSKYWVYYETDQEG
ncbi:carbohydrate ABC transporter permease [Paenibacillus sp. V4I5]|uniref:carbohydrate ABC transporter permease n=1 Tax=Paenibacillus sp. V4I5 TaxID=3042306 RepID=UPI002790AFD3|nr:sugar ABC transporter permease [Paenibacillus sp. V4I5]MDQ0920450.1 ABC-type sugar transport system permease subunit [Paenibacillus sp. V4I5]